MRDRPAEAHGRAQHRPVGRPPRRAARGDQSGGRRRRRRRPLRRGRQRRRAAGGHGRAGRVMHFRQRLRSDQAQARSRLRGHRAAIPEEHGRSGACLSHASGIAGGTARGRGGSRAFAAAGRTLDRHPAFREHEQRAGARALRRRADRGPDHRSVAGSWTFRHRPQLVIRLPGEAGRRPHRRPRSRRPAHSGRQHAAGCGTGADHRAIDRRDRRWPPVDRSLRPQAGGHLQGPGRSRRQGRRRGRTADGGNPEAQASGQPGCLRSLRARAGADLAVTAGGGGSAPALRESHRARSGVCRSASVAGRNPADGMAPGRAGRTESTAGAGDGAESRRARSK